MDAWTRILQWCEQNARKTFDAIREPRGEDDLNTSQRRTGGWNWTHDVIDFYSRCDGLDRTPAGYLFPGFRPLSLAEVVEHWEGGVDQVATTDSDVRPSSFPERDVYYAQVAADSASRYLDLGIAEAGTPAGRFVTPWLPIAEDQSGSFLVADRRRGGHRGLLIEVDKVDADHNARIWPSLTFLLGAVATALETSSVVAGSRYVPAVVAGELAWTRARRR